MNPITEKVLARLNLEKVLITTGVAPKRNRITCDEIFQTAKEEPRIYTVLPAILLYKPTIIAKLDRDLKRYPLLEQITQTLFQEEKRPAKFYGVETQDCAKAALTFRNFLNRKKVLQKSRTLTLRLTEEDINRLRTLTNRLKTGSVSETIRSMAKEKMEYIQG